MKNEKTAFLNRVMNIHPAQIRGGANTFFWPGRLF